MSNNLFDERSLDKLIEEKLDEGKSEQQIMQE